MKHNRALSALILALVVSFAVGGFALIQRGKAAEGDLVINGRGDAPIATPKTPVRTHESASTTTNPPPQPASEIVIDITGSVYRPGVYHLPSTARVEDAVKAAGGPTPDSDLDAVNLAAHVEDGKKIHIPSRNQTTQLNPGPQGIPPPYSAPPPGGSAPHAQKLTDPGQGTININSASEEELQRLPGIGRSYAEKIVQFRSQYGPFSSLEQLRDVPGIGEKRFEKIRAFIRIQ